MQKGMSVPIRTNKRGGAELTSGTAYTEQVIEVGLNPNYSMNPFQAGGGIEVGISEKVIFANNTPSTFSRARREVTNLFKRYREADLAKLASDNAISLNNAGEELEVTVRYLDLEADDEIKEFKNVPGALTSEPRVNYGQ